MKYTFEEYQELPEGKIELINGVLHMGGEPVRLIIFEKDVEQLDESGESLIESLEQLIAYKNGNKSIS